MSAAQPRHKGIASPAPVAAPIPHAEPAWDAGKPAAARLADELAVPAPSPVHRMQAGLAQLAGPAEAPAEAAFPGWFRLGFPLVASITIWVAIFWGVGLFA